MKRQQTIHPHVKSFIRSVILAEMTDPKSPVSMSASYRWKEELMKVVQNSVMESIETVSTDQELSALVDSKISWLRGEVDRALVMIQQTLKQVPLSVFRRG